MSLKKKISALILTATVGVSGLIGYNASIEIDLIFFLLFTL